MPRPTGVRILHASRFVVAIGAGSVAGWRILAPAAATWLHHSSWGYRRTAGTVQRAASAVPMVQNDVRTKCPTWGEMHFDLKEPEGYPGDTYDAEGRPLSVRCVDGRVEVRSVTYPDIVAWGGVKVTDAR